MRLTILALVAGALLAAGAARASDPTDPAPVIAAERAFAARAAEVGINPSFLEFMADEAIIFGQDPVSAKAFYGARPRGKAPKDGGTRLNWWPGFAGMARSGDLGFTTGPATINDGPANLTYATIWARQPDGSWKWVFDGGVDSDPAKASKPGSAPAILPPGDARPMARTAAFDAVRSQEAGTADFRLLGGGASRAGDLVWTYGDLTLAKGRGHALHVWQRRGGRWSLVMDQVIPVG